MDGQLDLLPDEPATWRVRPAVTEHLEPLAASLPHAIRFGTSSWSFPGWRDFVYAGAPSQELLAREGLRAYAKHPLLRAVGVDRSYYRPPSGKVWSALSNQAPEGFHFMVKAPRELVSPRQEGSPARNPNFLRSEWAAEEWLAPMIAGLDPGREASLLLQFPPLRPRGTHGPRAFADALGEFLLRIESPWPFAVELRNRELFTDRYVEALRSAGASHCLSVHPAAPLPEEQLAGWSHQSRAPRIVRWMLPPGLTYEGARDAFAPFDRIAAADPHHLALIGRTAMDDAAAGHGTVVIVNNKAEGSAPLTIERLARWIAEQSG